MTDTIVAYAYDTIVTCPLCTRARFNAGYFTPNKSQARLTGHLAKDLRWVTGKDGYIPNHVYDDDKEANTLVCAVCAKPIGAQA